MIARHVSVCHMLTGAMLVLLVCGTPAKAAPMGEAATKVHGISNNNGTLEIGKIGYDHANITPTGFSSTDVQPYASTEVETEAETATTSLPITIKEMALTEVAVVTELKGRDQQVIARELANEVASMKDVTVDDSDFVAATTFGTNFPHQMHTATTTITISPATETPIVPSGATESPAILGELVRAAAAANEILAAALNVATMAVSKINITTPATKVDVANLPTTLQPKAAPNTTSADNHEQVNYSEGLLETTEVNKWQHNDVENTEVNTAIPNYTTPPLGKENKAFGVSVSAEVNHKNLPVKELERIRENQTTIPIDIQKTPAESITKSAPEEATDLTDTDHEVSESMNIEKTKESQESLALSPPRSDKNFGTSTTDAENLVINIIDNIAIQTEPAVESTIYVASITTEKVNGTTETEDLKQVQQDQSLRETGENATEYAVRTTTTESLETLIAVESEAQVPNKIDFVSEKEVLETITTISEPTTIEDSSSNILSIASESILPTNKTITATTIERLTDENLTTETETNQQINYTTIAPVLVITTTGVLEEDMSSTESSDVKTSILETDNIAATEQSEMLVGDIQQTTTSSSPTLTSDSITETSDEQQTERSAKETTTVSAGELFTSFEKDEETAQNSLEAIKTTTNFIDGEITGTGIPLEENISTQSEISPTEASKNLANFKVFPNGAQQTTTEDITTLRNNAETTTYTTKAPATQPSEMDDTKTGTTTEIRETITATTEEELSTTIKTAENKLDSEDVAESEARAAAEVEEKPLYTSTVNEQLQQQRVVNESDSAKTTTNTIVTTEESAIEDADAATSTTTADIIATTTNLIPEVDVTTIILSTTPEQYITTTTTTTLSPMSLIVAEHEARSLDKTPPRVSRIVNEDGVEVLTGYSIVHQMQAAALAALATDGA